VSTRDHHVHGGTVSLASTWCCIRPICTFYQPVE
jgi:hypothetical protein